MNSKSYYPENDPNWKAIDTAKEEARKKEVSIEDTTPVVLEDDASVIVMFTAQKREMEHHGSSFKVKISKSDYSVEKSGFTL